MCCFIRIRVPRTKTEIVANSKRRALLKNFRVNITSLKAADLDDMDYKRGMLLRISKCFFLLYVLIISFFQLIFSIGKITWRLQSRWWVNCSVRSHFHYELWLKNGDFFLDLAILKFWLSEIWFWVLSLSIINSRVFYYYIFLLSNY